MKTILRSALAALLMVLVAGTAGAGETHPALWVVTRGDTIVYLFGTIHALKRDVTWFDGPVTVAFDRSLEPVLEELEPDPALIVCPRPGLNQLPGYRMPGAPA